MRKSIQGTLGRSDQVDIDRISLEIINAITHYRWTEFHFNRGVFTFTGSADTAEYTREALGTTRTSLTGPPYDCLKILRCEWRDPSDATLRGEVRPGLIDDIRHLLENSNTGEPVLYNWTINTATDDTVTDPSMMFGPAFDKAYTIACDYVQDIGTPGADYDGTNWNFVDPSDETTALAASFTNAWFTDGWDLIHARALRQIYLTQLYSPERASVYAQIEADALRSLHAQSRQGSPPRIRGWGLM